MTSSQKCIEPTEAVSSRQRCMSYRTSIEDASQRFWNNAGRTRMAPKNAIGQAAVYSPAIEDVRTGVATADTHGACHRRKLLRAAARLVYNLHQEWKFFLHIQNTSTEIPTMGKGRSDKSAELRSGDT